VFGIFVTTAFFALLHTPYAFTPGSLAILLVGGAFAVLKERYSTTAAIIAHFTYNFVLLGSAYFLLQAEEAGLLPDGAESIILVTSLILPF
ncbi:MAG: CPBP family glutamic-type intramembrane protease, partial [Chloroflexota bacterium]